MVLGTTAPATSPTPPPDIDNPRRERLPRRHRIPGSYVHSSAAKTGRTELPSRSLRSWIGCAGPYRASVHAGHQASPSAV